MTTGRFRARIRSARLSSISGMIPPLSASSSSKHRHRRRPSLSPRGWLGTGMMCTLRRRQGSGRRQTLRREGLCSHPSMESCRWVRRRLVASLGRRSALWCPGLSFRDAHQKGGGGGGGQMMASSGSGLGARCEPESAAGSLQCDSQSDTESSPSCFANSCGPPLRCETATLKVPVM